MAEPKNPQTQTGEHAEIGHEGARPAGGPLNIILSPDISIINEARKLIGDKNIRVEDVATCASQDPVLILELLKSANAMFFSAGRPPITAPKTAIVRLGQQVVQDIIDAILKRPQPEVESVANWINIHRSRCKRASIIARMLSEVVIKNFSDECQVAGLLMYMGELIAAAHLREDYVKLAEEQPRSSVNYRLVQDFKFDVEKIGLSYLRRNGIPEIILFALDREALSRSPERAPMKPVIMAADEIIESFDSNRWDKLAPGKQLPSKSAIRLLQISDSQYSRIYERASEYLFSMRIAEEKKKQQITESLSGGGGPTPSEEEIASWGEGINISSKTLQSDIEDLLSGDLGSPKTEAPEEIEVISPPEKQLPPAGPKPQKAPSKSSPEHLKNDYSLGTSPSKPARVSSPSAPAKITPPRLASTKSSQVVSSFASAIGDAENTEQLLKDLLGMLVGPGLFSKSALIVVSKDKKKALVVAARGPNIGNGQTVIIDDPLSPLAECFSKVQSFGNKESKTSPFGSKAFALSPIDAPHDTPVALYADCGNDNAVPFEARRIFRTVVEILNQKLPYLPGSIPVEV